MPTVSHPPRMLSGTGVLSCGRWPACRVLNPVGIRFRMGFTGTGSLLATGNGSISDVVMWLDTTADSGEYPFSFNIEQVQVLHFCHFSVVAALTRQQHTTGITLQDPIVRGVFASDFESGRITLTVLPRSRWVRWFTGPFEARIQIHTPKLPVPT